MGRAYNKDIRRSIWRGRKRFLSILAITALGVTVLAGIHAACQDMYYSADRFYDEQGLFDVRVLSTLGLTDEDVEALNEISGIEKAEGTYSETVDTVIHDLKYTAQMIMLSPEGMNAPYLLEGNLPVAAGEIAVTQKYLEAAGKSIGDTLTIQEKLEDEEKAEETEEIEEAPEILPQEEQVEADEDEETIEWDTQVDIEEETETPNFNNTEYTITAMVLDPMDISNNDAAFRSAATVTDFTFFVLPADVDSDIYTCIYLTLSGTKELDCYSDEYKAGVKEVIDVIETKIKEQREAARYNAIRGEAEEKIADAESTMNEKFDEADEKFKDAWDEIEEGRQELVDGERTLTKEEQDALAKIADARAEIADGRAELETAQKELEDGENTLLWTKMELDYNTQVLEDGKEKLREEKDKAFKKFEEVEARMADRQHQLDNQKSRLDTGLEQLKMGYTAAGKALPENEWNAVAAAVAQNTLQQLNDNPDAEPDSAAAAGAAAAEIGSLGMAIAGTFQDLIANGFMTQEELEGYISNSTELAVGNGMLSGSQSALDAGMYTYQTEKEAGLLKLKEAEDELHNAELQLEEGWTQWNDAWSEMEKGKQELADGWAELLEGEEELNTEEAKAKKEIADAWAEIEDGKKELAEGEAELVDNEEEYQDKKKDAEEKIADAYAKLDDIDMAQWYVQDRSSLSSYSSLKSDMSSIESIGGAFPIVFLVVAILISLTTMTRMVEEERGLIGTYKAMGLSNGAVYRKYLWYCLLACILGGVLGDVCGFIALPKFLLAVLSELYILPVVELRFDLAYGIGGVLLFMVGIVGATVMVCSQELIQMPAALMRPKAPRSGSRVFLERITFIWSHLKFLNKVTVRNLFRYKKRFFMTVFGIMGCTALVLAGFSIKDTVTTMMPKQYDDIYQYDMMAVVDAEDNQELIKLADSEAVITDYVNLEVSNVKVLNSAGESETVQLMVVPDGTLFDGYIRIRDLDSNPVALEATGILITKNAADILDLTPGSKVSVQKLNLDEGEVSVTAVVQNYLGNNIYMEKSQYEQILGDYSPNGILAHLSPECTDHITYAEKVLEDNDIILSSMSMEGIKKDFTKHFALINSVVYMITILAAGLAFVVLFTLSNTNISERARELATIKVLGFYDREVHSYVNKETLILTAIGILVGLPVGWFLSGLLTTALVMPSMYFETYVAPISYGYAIIISFSFALIVNLITNRTLNKINMVEALKSVE